MGLGIAAGKCKGIKHFLPEMFALAFIVYVQRVLGINTLVSPLNFPVVHRRLIDWHRPILLFSPFFLIASLKTVISTVNYNDRSRVQPLTHVPGVSCFIMFT